MDCNKDEAERAKSIAEKKFEQKDFAGARKFAAKAKTLYPDLDGISQLVATLEVYISAENKISGEIDWYGVLSVNPTADDEAIKRQYRKLALALHPDKNKSIGADGAFKLISEAWSLLSDKAKRLAYNQRRGFRIFQQRPPTHTAAPSARPPSRAPSARPPPRANESFNFARRPTSASKSQNKAAKAGSSRPTPTPAYQKPHVPPTPTAVPTPRNDTFWTICHHCKMQYEYLNIYCNQTLLCPNCQKPFKAIATVPPINVSKTKPVNLQQQQNSSSNVPNRNACNPGTDAAASHKPGTGESGPSSFKCTKNQQGAAPFGTANVGNSGPSVAAKAANHVVQQAADKLKRAFSESHPSAGWDQSSKKRKAVDDSNKPFGMNYSTSQFGMNYNTSIPSGMNYNMAHGNGGFGHVTSGFASGFRAYGFSVFSSTNQANRNRELTSVETQNMLMARARKEIRKKLSELKSKATAKIANKEKGKAKENNKDREGNNSNFKGVDSNEKTNLSGTKIAPKADKSRARSPVDDESTENPTAVAMTVPDPDFHDFDQDRSESSFGDNEVWAAYDDNDGMPRIYALVNKVISRDPFKVRIAWLNSKTNTEFSTFDWVGLGFYKTCGEFWVGKYEKCKFINAFSQRVNWSKTPRGSFVILPQKDDVWALYKNWSSDWDKNTPEEVIHKYDMVIVLDSYSEEKGASVAPLLKVDGFRTVFRPNLELEMIRRIPKEEIFRFSHRVPHHWLTSEEAQNAPEGCLELDPAATPVELLQMTIETDEVEVLPKTGNVGATIDTHAAEAGKGKQISQGDETERVQTVISGQKCLV